MGLTSANTDGNAGKKLEVLNKLGLHARPCSKFVRTAGQFRCEIWVEKDDQRVNGKSIMGLMMLAAGNGSILEVTCEGEDADAALAAIEKLMLSKFDEE